jgi:hypothetical protein
MNISEEGGSELNKQVDVFYLKVHSLGLELNLVRQWLDDNNKTGCGRFEKCIKNEEIQHDHRHTPSSNFIPLR